MQGGREGSWEGKGGGRRKFEEHVVDRRDKRLRSWNCAGVGRMGGGGWMDEWERGFMRKP